MRNLILSLSLSCGLLYGQTQKIATVSSSYPVTLPAGTNLSFSSAGLGISYPVGLTPGSYISATQLNTDFQTFLAAYPSPTDPPEAILSSVLQSILNKYPQMTGGTLTGEIPGTFMGVPIPSGGGSVTVVIGTYNPTTGFIGFSRSGPSTDASKVAPAVKSPSTR
jgi:hypothetical protein